MEKLTNKQEEVLTSIKKYFAKNGYAPTVRELCEELDLHSPATVFVHLKHLINKGYISQTTSKFRTLEIKVPNEFVEKNDEIATIPLLGRVAAGNPIEAIEHPDEYLTIPAHMIPRNKEVFSLLVQGESMINIGIYSGDTVIVERTNTAKNGDLVVALNENNEATLKTFFKEDGYFRLQPENDFMPPIILKQVTILGKAIALYREL